MGEPAATPFAGAHSLPDSHAEASTSEASGWQPPTAATHEEDRGLEEPEEVGDVLCGGCGKLINEDSAQGGVIHFATQLWHLECFRCAKCSQPVSTDRDDILLLSDGHPICASCNYSCQICGLPILEEAIMTGDESYHATCFTCRSCKEPIKELVFAKTSQGIYCMPCHSERVARSRRHSEARKKSGKHRDGSARRARQPTDGSQSTDKATQAEDNATQSQLPPSEPSATSIATSTSLTSTAEKTDAQRSEASLLSDHTLHPLSPGHTDNGIGEALVPSRAVTPSMETPATPQLPSTPVGTHHTSLKSQSQLRSPLPASPAHNYSRPVPPSAATASALQGLSSSATPQEPAAAVASPSSQSPAAESSKKGDALLPATPIDTSNGFTVTQAPLDGEADEDHSKQRPVQHVPVIRRSSEPDARDTVAALRSITASESAPNHASSSTRPGSASAIKLDRANSSQSFIADGRVTPTPPFSGVRNHENSLGSPLRQGGSRAAVVQESPVLPRSPSSLLPRASHFSSSSEDDAETRERNAKAQVKRASHLSFVELSSQDLAAPKRLDVSTPEPAPPETFSFYDADFAKLIDSISDADMERAVSGMSSPVFGDDASSPFADGHGQSGSRGAAELSSTDDTQMVTSQSGASMTTIQARMRESMSHARDGQVSMETAFIEMVLQELDDTRNRMKALRSKYDQLKRASQYAVQGIDYARVEYDAQRQARSDAEMEMLRLKERLAEQASKLAALAHSERQQETLDQRSKDVKTSLQDMTKSLTKLTVERDMKAAEVAELIAVQEGRVQLSSGPDASSSGEAEKLLQSRLSLRLDDVKARYRQDIEHLMDQRNELLIEIEDLRQSRDVYLEETETLNTRNEELNTLLSRLTAKVEAMSLTDPRSSASSRQSSRSAQAGWIAPGTSAGKSTSGFGFGFSTRGGRGHAVSPSIASSRDGFTGGSSAGYHSAADPEPISAPAPSRGAMNLPPQAAAQTRAEAVALASLASSSAGSLPLAPSNSAQGGANSKKFKWMKPISAKNSGSQGLSGPPVSPSPPIPPPKTGHHGHTSSASLQPSLSSSQREREMISHEQIVREHVFVPFHILRPTRCFACQKNMWGQSEVRCASCGQVCHSKCLSSLPISCTHPYMGRTEELGSEPAGPSMFGRSLVEQAAAEGREVPLVVEKCIQAVERNGMDYEGIYRKSGGSSQLRVITQLFERGSQFDLEDVERFNDVSAVTSVLKNYFRELPEPLMTYELHEGFITCIEQYKTPKTTDRPSSSADESGPLANGVGAESGKLEDAKLQRMREMVGQLPRAHLQTLKVLIGHLHQVAIRSDENRMTARNLGVVFGPTLMKSPDASKEFSEMGGKSLTVEYLCERFQDIFA